MGAMTRSPWPRRLFGASIGAAAFLVFGHFYALAGGT
jgi:hypothetical protein